MCLLLKFSGTWGSILNLSSLSTQSVYLAVRVCVRTPSQSTASISLENCLRELNWENKEVKEVTVLMKHLSASGAFLPVCVIPPALLGHGRSCSHLHLYLC